MNLRPRSIQRRLSFWLTAQSFLGLGVVCIAIYCVTAWSFGEKQSEELDRKAALVLYLLQESADGGDIAAMRHKLGDFFSVQDEVSVSISQAGRVVFESAAAPGGHWIWRNLQAPWRPSATGVGPVSVRIGLDIAQELKLLERLAWTLLCAAVLGTALVALTGTWLVRRGLQPLKALADHTAAISLDNPHSAIDAQAFAEELRPWISRFNALLVRVQRAYVQLEAFNADVAHELRTPLAILIGSTEVELSRPRSADEMQAVLASNLEEIRRLSGIVTDMLFLSQADRGVTMRSASPTSLAAQAQNVIDFHEAMLEEAGLHVRIVGDAVADVDASLVRRALSNLLGNAIRFATPASTIRLEIARSPHEATLSVVNRGPSIAPDILARLFERFYRADRARDRSSQHHGLGLSIVEAIARMHGGVVFASSTDEETRIGFSIAMRQASALAGGG